MRVGFTSGISRRCFLARVVAYSMSECEENRAGNTLATAHSLRTINAGNNNKIRGNLRACPAGSNPTASKPTTPQSNPKTRSTTTRLPAATAYELGKWLGTAPRDWAGEAAKEYLADIRETDPIYAKEGLGHPGLLQRVMNKALVDNAILGPWIHVGSRMQLLSAATSGDVITARTKVIGNYDKKGHRFVEFDALVVGNGQTPLAHCHHIAIYQPREQAAA